MTDFKGSQNNLSVIRPFYTEWGHCEGILTLDKVWIYRRLFGLGNKLLSLLINYCSTNKSASDLRTQVIGAIYLIGPYVKIRKNHIRTYVYFWIWPVIHDLCVHARVHTHIFHRKNKKIGLQYNLQSSLTEHE